MSGWVTDDEADGRQIPVFVNGSEKQAPADADFTETVKSLAAAAGLQTYKVKVGGVEIGPTNAPEDIGDASGRIEILPYQKAGC